MTVLDMVGMLAQSESATITVANFAMIRARAIRQHRIDRVITGLALALFLAMQLIGGAHFHEPPDVNHLSASSSAATPDQCPICLHHSQSTPAISAASPFVQPRSLVAAIRLEPEREVALEVRFALFGRAPPANV